MGFYYYYIFFKSTLNECFDKNLLEVILFDLSCGGSIDQLHTEIVTGFCTSLLNKANSLLSFFEYKVGEFYQKLKIKMGETKRQA